MRTKATAAAAARAAAIPKPHVTVQHNIETISSHDGTPCTITWQSDARRPSRPRASVQIYNTSPYDPSATPAQVIANNEFIAQKLEDDYFDRHSRRSDHRDRLDVYHYPLSFPTQQQPANQDELDRLKNSIMAFPPHKSYSEDELDRIASCIVHQCAEIAAREARPDYATESASLMLPARNWFDNTYNHFLVIIDSPPERWDDVGMLFVSFDVIDPAREAREAAYYGETPPPAIGVDRMKGADEIRTMMMNFRNSFDWDEFQSQPVTGLPYYRDIEPTGPRKPEARCDS